GDHAAGHLADLGDVEHLADLRVAEEVLAQGWREQARQRRFDVVHHVVDDRVVADLDLVAAGHLARLRVGAPVEADDERRGRARASVMSDSLRRPTAVCSTRTETSEVESVVRLATIASIEPCTSALTMIGSSLPSPALIFENICSSVPRAEAAASFSRWRLVRN